MATRYGSDRSFLSTNTGGVYDTDGNEVISSSNQFGSFPLGPAALAQTLFSVPNGTFNLLPPTMGSNIGPSNPLPYWDIPIDDSDNLMSGKVIFDTTTNTYALRLTPGTALSGNTYAITTRSAVISDDNLALRQKAIATLEKVGTYAGATQVNLSLSATYYDALGSAISTQAIGTVYDNAAISSITGFTTAGTAAVGISASYVDLTFTMTATANVSSGISFDINTILLQTSQGAGQSFLVTESFTSSTTWTRPTGVEYLVGVIAVGGGGGGGGGAFAYGTAFRSGGGGGGGGAGAFALVQNLYVGNAGSVSIGIGASGSGGTAGSKLSGTAVNISVAGGTGANGGATTFGAYITANGGSGAGGGSVYLGADPSGTAAGGTGGTASNLVLGGITYGGTTGASTSSVTSTNGLSSTLSAFTYVPFVTTPAAGASGGTAGTTINGATSNVGTATTGGAAGYQGGGGGGGGIRVNSSTFAAFAAKSAGAGGAGGGGAHCGYRGAINTGTAFSGAGGSASASSGAGGGGGGAFIQSSNDSAADRCFAGTGGAGATGFVIIAYIA